MIDVQLLKSMSSLKKLHKGSVICREATPDGREMFILLDGIADVFKSYNTPSEVKLATLNPGSFFGEMSLFLNKERTATIVAVTDVIILAISSSNAFEFFSRQPEATYTLIATLCYRLDSANNAALSASTPAATKPAAPVKATEPVHSAPAPASAAPPPTPAPAPPPEPIPDSVLFPSGHSSYSLLINTDNPEYLFTKSQACPLCKSTFKYPRIRESKLIQDHIDFDLRTHYKNIEPLIFNVVTCPTCLYSASVDSFNDVNVRRLTTLRDTLQLHKSSLNLNFGTDFNSTTLFASYYLALLCAPCFTKHELITARLWLRLSWLYHDVEDSDMEAFAAKEALDAYLKCYSVLELPPTQMQQLTIIIGELYFKANDFINARKFLFQAQTNKSGSPMYVRLAEDRLSDIKDIIQKNK